MDTSESKAIVPSFDAFIPPEMAIKAEKVGLQKAAMGWQSTIALAVLAGGFIFSQICFP